MSLKVSALYMWNGWEKGWLPIPYNKWEAESASIFEDVEIEMRYRLSFPMDPAGLIAQVPCEFEDEHAIAVIAGEAPDIPAVVFNNIILPRTPDPYVSAALWLCESEFPGLWDLTFRIEDSD